ncbi:MAG: ATP-binding cassette domain-containing protein [Nitrospiraceae bacterium]|nr:ATP-binding cassette domain-containing protein [Nitrospiraceae bacterium]
MEAVIRLEKVTVAYGEQVVLDGIDLEVPTGKTMVILGESGSGKTTILKCVLGTLHPVSGRVLANDLEVGKLTDEELLRFRRRMGMVFQEGALFDSMTVGENVAFWLWEHTTLSDDKVEERVRMLLQFVGLESSIDQMPSDLSGGMRRRVAIARAMAAEDPAFMLYDEPTTGLDPFTSKSICDLMRRVQREFKSTNIVVTHDLTDAYRVGDLFTFIKDAKVIATGTRQEIEHSSDPFIRTFISLDS